MSGRSLESFDEGYRSGIAEGVRWSKDALREMLEELDVSATMGEAMMGHGSCVYEDTATKILKLAMAKLDAAPLDQPLVMRGAPTKC